MDSWGPEDQYPMSFGAPQGALSLRLSSFFPFRGSNLEFVRAKKPDPKKDSRDTSALSSRREANTTTPELPLYLRSAQQSLVSSPNDAQQNPHLPPFLRGFFSPATPQTQAAPSFQAKLAIAPSTSPLEQDADDLARTAARRPINSTPSPLSASNPAASPNPLTGTSGEPLRPHVRERVEPLLGVGLEKVRVHQAPSDREAASRLKARAFTHREHVFLGKGESPEDVELVAHELAHVVQQGGEGGAAIQRKPSDYRHEEDGAGPRDRMQAEIDEELGDRTPPDEEPEIDRSRVRARERQLTPMARPEVDRPAEERPGVEAAAEQTDQVVDEPATAEGEGKGESKEGEGAQEAAAGEAEAAAAEGAFASAEAEPEVNVPRAFGMIEQVQPLDAGGKPLEPVAGASEAIAEIADATQCMRDEGTGLQEIAATERANARILEGNINLIRMGVAQADLGVSSSQSHAAYRQSVVEQGRSALSVSREKTAWVAEQAPLHLEKADEGREDSEGMAEEASSTSAEAEANVPDDEEAAAEAEEQNGEINRAGGDVENLDQAFSGSQERARGLSADAEQASALNDQVESKLNEGAEMLQRTEERLGQMRAETDEARGQVETLAGEPGEIIAQADETEAEGQAVIEASFAVEERLRAEQLTHRMNAAAIPAETPEEKALREEIEGEAPRRTAEMAMPVQPVPAEPEMVEAAPEEGGGAEGEGGEEGEGEAAQAAEAQEAEGAEAGGELETIEPRPPGEGAEIAVQRLPQTGYEDRWNVDLAAPIAEEIPQLLGGTAPREGEQRETREQREIREQLRREQEIRDIQTMAGKPFEQTSSWERRGIALRLMGRNLWNGLKNIPWPGWGTLALGLINPITPLLGVVSGFSLIASGAANLVNIQAWKRDPIGNLLKIAADIATGLTIILGSITALAAVIAALCTALIIFSFGTLSPALGPVVAFCANVMVTVGGWTIAVGKWALLLQFLCFLKNLYEAGVARNAAELQQSSDRMASDVSAAGNVVLQMGMAKLAQVGGRGLQNSISRAGGGVRWAGGLRTRIGTGLRDAGRGLFQRSTWAGAGGAIRRALPQIPRLPGRAVRGIGAGIRAMPGQAMSAVRGLPQAIRSPIQSLRQAFGPSMSRGALIGENVAPGWTGLRTAVQEGAWLARHEAITGLSTAELQQAIRLWQREGVEMLIADGLTGTEIRLLSSVSEANLRRLLLQYSTRELADLGAIVGPAGLDVMGQMDATVLSRLIAGGGISAELPTAINELGIPFINRMQGLTSPEIVELGQTVTQLRGMNNIQGLDDWLRFEMQYDAQHVRNAMAELREARRLAMENPSATVSIGGDVNPPMRNATDPMQSFDINVQSAVGGAERNVELMTVKGQVIDTSQLSGGVHHAGDKVATRIADHLPITGEREAVIAVDFFRGSTPVGRGGRGGTITYDGHGGYIHQPPHPSAAPRVHNIIDDFFADLPTIRNNQLLERVRLVDLRGNVLAEFERRPTGWVRIR